MIAVSATVGIGLFLQIGNSFKVSGPLLAMLLLTAFGAISWSVMTLLVEMVDIVTHYGYPFEHFERYIIDIGMQYATINFWFAIQSATYVSVR